MVLNYCNGVIPGNSPVILAYFFVIKTEYAIFNGHLHLDHSPLPGSRSLPQNLRADYTGYRLILECFVYIYKAIVAVLRLSVERALSSIK